MRCLSSSDAACDHCHGNTLASCVCIDSCGYPSCEGVLSAGAAKVFFVKDHDAAEEVGESG